ncbi:MAG: glycoside hydrolase, partial [Verrucomicrobiota bacterium]
MTNLRNATQAGRAHGASGVLITDWGDNGHGQPPAVSWPGWMHGAGLAWCYEANVDMDVPAVLDEHGFMDQAGLMGGLTCDLGNLYLALRHRPENHAGLFHLLRYPDKPLEGVVDADELHNVLARLDAI